MQLGLFYDGAMRDKTWLGGWMKILRVRMNADILQYFCGTGIAVGFNSRLVGASKLKGGSYYSWVMPDFLHQTWKDKNSRGSWCFVIN
jgi:hypothetical protein